MNTKTKSLDVETKYTPSVRGNPADALQTFYVTIMKTDTMEIIDNLRTHHYNDEACAFEIMQELKDGYELVSVYNPILKSTVTPKDIQKEEK